MNFPRIVSLILNSTTINYSYRRFDARRFILHEIYPVSRTRLPGIDEFFHGNLCGRIF